MKWYCVIRKCLNFVDIDEERLVICCCSSCCWCCTVVLTATRELLSWERICAWVCLHCETSFFKFAIASEFFFITDSAPLLLICFNSLESWVWFCVSLPIVALHCKLSCCKELIALFATASCFCKAKMFPFAVRRRLRRDCRSFLTSSKLLAVPGVGPLVKKQYPVKAHWINRI